MRKLDPEFTFAGFTWPRYIPEFSKSKYDRRTFRAVYYHAPKPLTGGLHPGRGFYLADHGSPSRWKWCDDVVSSIRHKGWFCDPYQDETIRGLVVLLPHGRYLAGWSMGEGMASEVGGYIYTDIKEAARAADQCAEYAAERERDYQEEEERKRQEEEANQGADEEGDLA